MFRKLLSFLMLLMIAKATFSQRYRNEWIDYSKTYYKFKVGSFGYDYESAPIKNGVVRITQPDLVAAGLGSIPAEQFQLWRDGKEVPLYLSVPTGILSSSDYIEFWGEMANGKADGDLYRDTSLQMSDRWSLETDSASYFLTANPSGNNKRLVEVNNNVNTLLKPEKNFMYTVGRYYRYEVCQGYAIVLEQRLCSSSYEKGEGWCSRPVHSYNPMPQFFPDLYLDKNGAAMTAKVNMMGNTPFPREVRVSLNGNQLSQVNMGYFQTMKLNIPGIAANSILNDTAGFLIQNLSPESDDEMHVAQIELAYPRKYNFGNATNFEFYLPASDKGRYLKVANFSTNGVAPILYDLENGKRYVGDISITDTIRFVLQRSGKPYHLVLVRGDGSTAIAISSFQQRQFIDYSQVANQGNYLIISNPILFGSGSNNYVEQYNDYRRSVPGGHFNSIIVDVHQLEDQFAYGVKFHPLSVKNFLSFARNKFTVAPAFVFIIGKGVAYNGFRSNGEDPMTDQLNLVPTFGSPGSDNLLSSDNYDPDPTTPIGRLSVISSGEVGDYLAKVIQYEKAQQSGASSIEKKAWMKNVLQLTGANDPSIGSILDTLSKKYKKIISDSLFGGNVITYSKSGDPGGYPKAVADFKNTFNSGASLLEYFGHSSSTNLDFSLDDPANYDNTGKYPFFIVNGCLAGNIFDNDPNRLINRSTVSEKFVLEPQKGAIAYLSTSSFGVVSYLDIFTKQFYKSISTTQYGKSLGEIIREGIYKGLNITGKSDFYGKIHAEQYTLHGDPALKMNSFDAPDYVVQSNYAEVLPSFISVADKRFSVKIKVYNIGRATGQPVHFSLYRRTKDSETPLRDSILLFSKLFKPIETSDSVLINVRITPNKDTGTIKLFGIIDDDNKISELSENNNKAKILVNVSSQEIRPIFPYNYSIVTTGNVNLSASTANPFDTLKEYIMEMDTTALFNSTSKITRQKFSRGGVIQFLNVPLLQNDRVYYWRIAPQSVDPHWNMFSFVHKISTNAGFEQSHFFQHTESTFDRMSLDSSRQFNFTNKLTNLFVLQSIYPTSGTEDAHFSVSVNGSYVAQSACIGYSIMFNIFDPLTFKPVPNTTNPYGAAEVCAPSRLNNFEFHTTDPDSRKAAMDFLDNYVPDGYYVVARKIYDDWADNGSWASVWAADTAIYGHNNSLYNRLKDQGLAIDSFYFPRTFVFVFKKNDSTNYKPISVFSDGLYDRIILSENLTTKDTIGSVISPVFGPGKTWKKVTWSGTDINANNIAKLEVRGVKSTGKDSLFYSIDKTQQSIDISAIDPIEYPFVQLRMNTQDSVTATPFQLQNWSVEYTPVPEGGLAPNMGFHIPKLLAFPHDINIDYDTLQGYVTFKNVSTQNFDSLLLSITLYDDNNLSYYFPLPRLHALAAGDTMHIPFNLNLTALPAGHYNFFMRLRPGYLQHEQFHFNNLLYKFLTIKRGPSENKTIEFAAQPLQSNVLLKWKTETETGFDHYEVDYSKDGISFSPITNVPLSYGNNKGKNYTSIHNNPVIGKNYYRLKTVYAAGHYTYSAIRVVNFGTNTSVKVYPNPFTNILSVSVNKNAKGIVRIFELSGKQVLQQSFDGNTSINVSALASGNYIVQLDDGTSIQSFKLEKQKR